MQAQITKPGPCCGQGLESYAQRRLIIASVPVALTGSMESDQPTGMALAHFESDP